MRVLTGKAGVRRYASLFRAAPEVCQSALSFLSCSLQPFAPFLSVATKQAYKRPRDRQTVSVNQLLPRPTSQVTLASVLTYLLPLLSLSSHSRSLRTLACRRLFRCRCCCRFRACLLCSPLITLSAHASRAPSIPHCSRFDSSHRGAN